MIDWLEAVDQQITIFLNGFHSPVMDQVMWVITNKFTWIPLYALLIFYLFKYHKKEAWFWLVGIVILIVITDQFTSSFLKPLTERLRPCHDPDLQGLIHNYKKCGGQFSFVSGHSANSFAIATFFFLLLKSRLKFIWTLFIFAVIVAYSRVYLGVHFLGDILAGGIIGCIFAFIIYKIVEIFLNTRSKKGPPN